jgi:predicted RNase H-like HicB family nuclease
MRRRMDLTALIHTEGDGYWAEVKELPGCFATGDTVDELLEALREGISLCLDADQAVAPLHLASATLTDRPLTAA